jgi:hypothetical protein
VLVGGVDVPGSAIAGVGWFALAGIMNFAIGIALLSVSQQRIGAVRTGPPLATTPRSGPRWRS